MEIIVHRVNSIKMLKKIPINFGVEIDLRAYQSKIILNHEPFKSGDLLENYLSAYNNGTLILNIKESGIEDEVIRLVKLYNIKSYFETVICKSLNLNGKQFYNLFFVLH